MVASNNAQNLPHFLPGNTVNIYGYAPAAGTFNIDVVPEYGTSGYSLDDAICLRLSVDIENYKIVRSSFAHGTEWFVSEDEGYTGLERGRYFQMTIVAQTYSYQILINGYPFTTYYHRIPFTEQMWITVDPTVKIEPIEYGAGY